MIIFANTTLNMTFRGVNLAILDDIEFMTISKVFSTRVLLIK